MELRYLQDLGLEVVSSKPPQNSQRLPLPGDEPPEDFDVWLQRELSAGQLGEKFPSLCLRLAEVASSWRRRFDPQLWGRLARDKCSTLIKEAREAVPAIDFVQQRMKDLDERDGKITIVDLCSGLGFLGMFLSELLPPDRVQACLLMDQAWPMKGSTGEMPSVPSRKGRTRLNWDHIYNLHWPIPLVTRRCDLKLPSTHLQILSRLLDPAPGPVMILGIHLCGLLSIRAIETFNQGPKCVAFGLKPCCLPSMHYARQQVRWTLGAHTFAAAEVCCWGSYHHNRWTGPVKATMAPRFRCWAEHLHRGIQSEWKAIVRVELVEAHYQDTYLFASRPFCVRRPAPPQASPKEQESRQLLSMSGLCYYSVDCDSALPCCSADQWVSSGQSNSTNVVNLGSLIVYVAFTVWLNRWMNDVRQRYDGDEDPRPPSGIHDGLNLLGVYVGVCVTVFVSIAMASSTQLALPVPERNSMLAAMAFLTPDIFQFLEDTTTVKITLALGAGDYSAIRPIALLGIWGGLAAGVIGALLMTVLAWWPEGVIHVLLAPGSSDALARNPNCQLLPSAEEVVTTARGLWLLTSWSWPLQFCSMVLSGLLMGAREFAIYGMATIAAQGALAGIWFMGGVQDLHLLGWATFLSNLVLCISLAICLALHRPLRRKMGLLGAQLGEMDVLKDGILAMILDLALQFAGTTSVYVAAFVSLQDMYQLSAAGAALPQFSAYATAVGYVVRLVGGALVGRQAYAEFTQLMKVMVALSVILGFISAVGIYWNKTSLAAYYSVQACEFASSRECLEIYAGLYAEGLGKYDTTIFTTFDASHFFSFILNLISQERQRTSFLADVFGLTAMATCIFNVVKAGLYACQDFKYMAVASLWVMLLVFLPVLLLARFFFVSATALYVASVLPSWVLTVVFLLRLRSLSFQWDPAARVLAMEAAVQILAAGEAHEVLSVPLDVSMRQLRRRFSCLTKLLGSDSYNDEPVAYL
eukprot:s361_g2.t1